MTVQCVVVVPAIAGYGLPYQSPPIYYAALVSIAMNGSGPKDEEDKEDKGLSYAEREGKSFRMIDWSCVNATSMSPFTTTWWTDPSAVR